MCQEMRDVTGGNFRITGASLQEVLMLAEEWINAADGHRFRYLAVRDASRPNADNEDRMATIDFLYALPGERGVELESKDFFRKRTDQLRRRFGNGLTRWDVSSPVHMVRFGNN